MDGLSNSAEKWGQPAIAAGFTVVPNHLISINQFLESADRLSPTEIVVILQILASWWSKDKLPFPSKSTIGARAGLSPRQVQRALTSLEDKGLIERKVRFNQNRGRTSNQYDLSKLVARIGGLAEQHPSAFKRSSVSAKQEDAEDDA